MDLAERRKERPERLLRDERRQPAHEHSRVVRVRRRQLLPVGADEVRQDRARLCVVLPRLLREIVSLRHKLVVGLLSEGRSNRWHRRSVRCRR